MIGTNWPVFFFFFFVPAPLEGCSSVNLISPAICKWHSFPLQRWKAESSSLASELAGDRLTPVITWGRATLVIMLVFSVHFPFFHFFLSLLLGLWGNWLDGISFSFLKRLVADVQHACIDQYVISIINQDVFTESVIIRCRWLHNAVALSVDRRFLEGVPHQPEGWYYSETWERSLSWMSLSTKTWSALESANCR